MIRPMISVVIVALLIVLSAILLRPQSHSVELAAAAMPPLVQLHQMAGVDKLPTQEIDDQSLIYPTPTK